MLVNNVDDAYLAKFVPLVYRYMFETEGQEDHSEQISIAFKKVKTDLVNGGLNPADLMPNLNIRTSGTALSAATTGDSFEDPLSRDRLVIETTAFSGGGTKTVTLQGSADQETWTDVTSLTITATGTQSVTFDDSYNYYRIKTAVSAGEIDYKAYLKETTYDDLIAKKALSIIMRNLRESEGDKYDLLSKDFENEYQEQFKATVFSSDDGDDGVIDSSVNAGQPTLSR